MLLRVIFFTSSHHLNVDGIGFSLGFSNGFGTGSYLGVSGVGGYLPQLLV
jgi:hypothetical protein